MPKPTNPPLLHFAMVLGAVGVCCQKISEAGALGHGGVLDVLVEQRDLRTSRKLARLAALARDARVAVCVDDTDNVDALSFAAQNYGVNIDLLVEVNVGANRCGLVPGDAVLAMAQRVAAAPGLRLRGLQAYQGAAQHIRFMWTGRQRLIWPLRRFVIPASCWHGMASFAKTSRGRERELTDLRDRAGSTLSFKPAPTYLWMRITSGTSMKAGGRLPNSSVAYLCMRR